MERAVYKLLKDIVRDSGYKGLSAEVQDNIKSVQNQLSGKIDKSDSETKPTKEPEPAPDKSHEKLPEWCNSKEDIAAFQLLSGEGLNHSSFTRALKMDSDKISDKELTKETYDLILKNLGDKIHKQGHDWFFVK